MNEKTETWKGVAPYVWFKCPITKKEIVDQIILHTPFPTFFMLNCRDSQDGCGGTHKNSEVEVVAIGRYLGLDENSKYYSQTMVQFFELFLKAYDYKKLPEMPK